MFDEKLFNLVDWEMWLRISKFYHFKFIDEPLVVANYHCDNISNSRDSLIEALKLILARHFEDFRADKKLLRRYYITLGHLLMSNRQTTHGWNYLLKALKVCPLHVELLLATPLAFLGPKIYNKVVGTRKRTKSLRMYN